mgnify:CR=1 FL=1
MRLPIPQHLAANYGVAEVAVGEVDFGEVLAIAQGEKALRRGSAEGAFLGEFHVSEVRSQRLTSRHS